MSWRALAEGIAEGERSLSLRLAECGVSADDVPHFTKRLARPPLSFAQSASVDPAIFSERFPGGVKIYAGSNGVWEATARGFDGNMAARMLRLNDGRPDPKATWKALSRAERKRAKLLWDWTGNAHGLTVTLQGRPPLIDAALVLYLMRVLCEATGRQRFPFSRSVHGAPTGTMWRALIEALPLAQSFLARRYRGYGVPAIGRVSTKRASQAKIDGHAETIAKIVTVARSRPFNELCRGLWLGPTSDDVAVNAAVFRVVIAYARQSRCQN